MSIPIHPMTDRAIRGEFIKNFKNGEKNLLIKTLDEHDGLYATWTNVARYFENVLGCYYIEHIQGWMLEEWRWNLYNFVNDKKLSSDCVVARMNYNGPTAFTPLIFTGEN